jgi:hypothetical protein
MNLRELELCAVDDIAACSGQWPTPGLFMCADFIRPRYFQMWQSFSATLPSLWPLVRMALLAEDSNKMAQHG